MVTVELVVVGFLELCTPIFIVNEKTEYDGIFDAFWPFHNARRSAVPWRSENIWVRIYVDISEHSVVNHVNYPMRARTINGPNHLPKWAPIF